MPSPRLYKVEAIILKRKNIGETDRMLVIFTKEYGKMNVLAKGIRKITSKRGSHVEVFTHVTMVLHRARTWDLVSEVTTVENFSRLRSFLPRVSVAYYICELLDRLLPEKQEHRDISDLTIRTLQTLDDKDTPSLSAMRDQFTLTLLQLLGFLPKDSALREEHLEHYIESILEKRLRTPKILHRLLT